MTLATLRAGACEHDIDLFCAKVEPGEGRLAGCLSEQLEAQAAGDTVGERQRWAVQGGSWFGGAWGWATPERNQVETHRLPNVGGTCDSPVRCMACMQPLLPACPAIGPPAYRCPCLFGAHRAACLHRSLTCPLRRPPWRTLPDCPAGRAVSIGCYEELSAFMLDRATNINKDVPLARACRDDVKKHCSKKKYDRDNAADVLDCLRRLPKKKVGERGAQAWAAWRPPPLLPGGSQVAAVAGHRRAVSIALLRSMHVRACW